MRRRSTPILIVTIMLTTLLAFLIVNSDTSVSSTTYGEGHITSDEVWNLTKSPIYIEGNLTLDYGVNLTIEPGVEVFFNGFYNLYIEGNLSAIGNESDMIKFTSNKSSPNVRDWDSIQINKTGYAEIKYCNITYANYGISISESPLENDLQYNIISNNWMGLSIFDSLNNTIMNNNISDNDNHGTFLSYSSGNYIQDNILSNNGKLGFGNGLHLHYSSYNTIQNNDILDNNLRGIFLFFSDSNEMRYNRICSNSYDGIKITQSSDNEIWSNNISLNGYNGNYPGINLTLSTQNNRIFHNTIIDNADQANDGTNNSNQWDDGYPNGGNYWSDYSGVDNNRSENQDVPGSDGIGDTPYMIDNNSLDNYPLMNKTRNIAPYLFALISPYNNSIIQRGTIIDLHILVLEYNDVNYSINGTGNFPLNDPWDINTSGWSDGGNRIDVYVNDTSGNVNSSWFLFTVDSTKPIIELISPLNNSIILAGEIINISISDPHIKSTRFCLNDSIEQDLLFPYDIDTTLWPDGIYNLTIRAEDVVGNVNSTLYVFTLDSSPPLISLNSPVNNSFIKPGIPINISILDEHLNTSSISYYVDGQGPQFFVTPYIIDTIDWEDESYLIEVDAADILGNSIIKSFNISIDSILPTVILNHPLNHSVIRNTTLLNFSVIDASPVIFKYYLNIGNIFNIFPPYDIDISSKSDGDYVVTVNVTDFAGNYNQSWYNITIDSTDPIISLLTLSDNSTIKAGTEIDVEIVEPNLGYANYSIDGGEFQNLTPSFKINTTGWPEGIHIIEVFAIDLIGNNESVVFVFNVDNSPPEVIYTSPKGDEEEVELNTSIIFKFSEVMDKDSVENAISISPFVNYTLSWSFDNQSIRITPVSDLKNDTIYTVVISTSAKDIAGNGLEKVFVLKFNTGKSEKLDWLIFVFAALLIIILVCIIFVSLMYLRAKRSSEEEEAEEEEAEEKNEFELEEGEVEKGKKEFEEDVMREEPEGEEKVRGLEEELEGEELKEE